MENLYRPSYETKNFPAHVDPRRTIRRYRSIVVNSSPYLALIYILTYSTLYCFLFFFFRLRAILNVRAIFFYFVRSSNSCEGKYISMERHSANVSKCRVLNLVYRNTSSQVDRVERTIALGFNLGYESIEKCFIAESTIVIENPVNPN